MNIVLFFQISVGFFFFPENENTLKKKEEKVK